MKAWIGKSLLVIGILHTGLGFVLYQSIIGELAQELFFDAIGDQPERRTAFWFFVGGFTFMIIGGLINWAEKQSMVLPSFLKWALLALAVWGCLMIPVSGCWTLFVPVAGLFLQKNRQLEVNI